MHIKSNVNQRYYRFPNLGLLFLGENTFRILTKSMKKYNEVTCLNLDSNGVFFEALNVNDRKLSFPLCFQQHIYIPSFCWSLS